MQEKKKKNIYLFCAIGLVLILFLCVYLFISYSKNNYSFVEKNYINNNLNNVIDVSIKGGLPIYSDNGEGVFYEFISSLEEDTNLTFNKIVNGQTGYLLTNKNKIEDSDLLLYTDHYVLISNNNSSINNIEELSEEKIAVLNDDYDYVNTYFKSYNLNLVNYVSFDRIVNDMESNIQYAIVPLYSNLNNITFNNYNIIKHFEGLHSHFVLTLSNDSTLNSIIKKFYNNNKDLIQESMYKNIISYLYNYLGISDIQKEQLIENDIIIGYIDNLPIEGKINGNFTGFSNAYYKIFSNLTGVTYNYIKYDNADDLINALNNNKIDIAYNYYNLSNDNYNNSNSIGQISYAVVTNLENDISISDINSILDDKIKIIKNSSLNSYLNDLGIKCIQYDNYNLMLKDLNENDILVIEKNVYDYYRDNKLDNFVIKYIGNININSNFLINKNDEVLFEVFNSFINLSGVTNMENISLIDSINNRNSNVIIKFLLNNLIYILSVIAVCIFLYLTFNKKVKLSKKIKKVDKMMYLDVMTNLKNRNYLNENLNYWESNRVYPQAVVIMDLNDISIINDTKGHEEGDKQIKAAASILIKSQRENSEIIRTDGNEFLVYMVGYDERLVVTYINKLIKDLKELPYEYGASLGYSMITSESTTIDDAINEALIMMRKNKGEK